MGLYSQTRYYSSIRAFHFKSVYMENYYRLIQAFHQLIQTHQFPFDLVLVGEAKKTTEEERISKYIDEHNLNDRIHLLDFVAQVDFTLALSCSRGIMYSHPCARPLASRCWKPWRVVYRVLWCPMGAVARSGGGRSLLLQSTVDQRNL